MNKMKIGFNLDLLILHFFIHLNVLQKHQIRNVPKMFSILNNSDYVKQNKKSNNYKTEFFVKVHFDLKSNLLCLFWVKRSSESSL